MTKKQRNECYEKIIITIVAILAIGYCGSLMIVSNKYSDNTACKTKEEAVLCYLYDQGYRQALLIVKPVEEDGYYTLDNNYDLGFSQLVKETNYFAVDDAMNVEYIGMP